MKKILLLLVGAFVLVSVFATSVQGVRIATDDMIDPWAKSIIARI